MSESDRTTVEQLRDIAIAMGSWYERWYVGWTTDERKAHAAEGLGARVRHYTSTSPKFSGWEIVVPREVNEGGRHG